MYLTLYELTALAIVFILGGPLLLMVAEKFRQKDTPLPEPEGVSDVIIFILGIPLLLMVAEKFRQNDTPLPEPEGVSDVIMPWVQFAVRMAGIYAPKQDRIAPLVNGALLENGIDLKPLLSDIMTEGTKLKIAMLVYDRLPPKLPGGIDTVLLKKTVLSRDVFRNYVQVAFRLSGTPGGDADEDGGADTPVPYN